MKKKHKPYPLSQSPLYKLNSRKKLCSILKCSPQKLKKILNNENNYYEFDQKDKNGKTRRFEVPRPSLEIFHRRLFNLLTRIEAPTYLHSGTKGRSHLTNAKSHIGSKRMISLDVQKFYPSTRGWHIYDFFNDVMKCSPDVSSILKDLSTYNDHVPTGSCLSQQIAFYAHYKMFNEISELAQSFELIDSYFVDDLTLSGERVSKYHLNLIRQILLKRGLKSHPRKEKIYGIHSVKEVTGSIVTKNNLLLPNKKHKTIHEQIQHSIKQQDLKNRINGLRSTLGKAVAAAQSDPRIRKRVFALKCEIKKIEKEINTSPKYSFTKAKNSIQVDSSISQVPW